MMKGETTGFKQGLAKLEKLDPLLKDYNNKAYVRLEEAFRVEIRKSKLNRRKMLAKGISEILMSIDVQSEDDAHPVHILMTLGKQLNEGNKKIVFNVDRLLMEAVKFNPSALLIYWLISDDGANVNQPDNYGRTLLHRACKSGSLDVVKTLIEQGANVNQPDNSGRTPLHWACKNGASLEIIKYLVSQRRQGGSDG